MIFMEIIFKLNKFFSVVQISLFLLIAFLIISIIAPIIAIKIFITRTISEKVRAEEELTPNSLSSMTRVFSLSPNPPKVIGIFEIVHVTGMINIKGINPSFILMERPIK